MRKWVLMVTDQGFDAYRSEIEAAERRVSREIDPGARAVVVAALVLVLIVSLLLPQTGDARGVDVLVNSAAAKAEMVALPHRVFCWLTLVFGIGISALALTTRRWGVAWVALAGSAVACAAGMLAVWSRQTVNVGRHLPEVLPGPGIGLIIGWIAIIALTFHWARVIWARTAAQYAAEELRQQRPEPPTAEQLG